MIEPAIYAHRGAPEIETENTIAAFNAAWRTGVDGIEGDFHLTADGIIVCHHDDTTGRLGDSDLKIADTNMSQLQAVTLKGGHRIPLLGDVLATVPTGRRILIELKGGPAMIAPLMQDLRQSKLMPDQITLMSFNPETVLEAAGKATTHQRLFLLDPVCTEYPAFDNVEAWVQLLKSLNVHGIGASPSMNMPDYWLTSLKQEGFVLSFWTIDDADQAQRLVALGADMITTNRPAEALSWLGRL